MLQSIGKVVNRRLATAFVMGVSSGLPLLLTITLMQAWAKEAGVSLADIGLMSLVGLPYTVKFLFAPIFDHFTLPFLGRRRGWLIVIQIFLILTIIVMGYAQPAAGEAALRYFILSAVAVSFASSCQDVVIDAYRREDLHNEELGLGSSYYIYGYRIGMLAVSGGGLILADHIAWHLVFVIMAICLIPGLIMTLLAPEPAVVSEPRTFRASVLDPFTDYFKRQDGVLILVFILLYKIGDTMAGALTTPFYLELGFTKSEIGAVVKLFGFWATMGGGFLGGVLMMKLGINRALWVFGFLQMASTVGFALLAQIGKSLPLMAGVVSFENLSAGMGTAAFVAFMANLTNKKFTATQYALLSSLMGVPRVIASSVTGYLVEALHWTSFYLVCTALAVPGMLLLRRFAPWDRSAILEPSQQ